MKIRLILTFLLLGGCASSPEIHYYTLSVRAPAARSGHTSFTLAAVRLPAITDRLKILLRTGPQTVDLLDNDRWAEPLDQAVPRILAQDLALRQQDGGNGQPLYLVIDNFIADRAGEVQLSGHWWCIAKGMDRASAERHPFELAAPMNGTGAAQIAAAMSEALAGLADHLTARR